MDWPSFGDIINAITAPFLPPGVSTVVGAGAQTAYSQVTDVTKAKVKEWWTAVNSVKNSPIPSDPELVQWRTDILDRAETIKNMIIKLVDQQSIKDMGLGLAPIAIIGGVAISGVLAYIAYQMTDITKYFARLNFIKNTVDAQVKSGVDTATAYKNAVDAADNAGQTNGNRFMGVPVKYIAVGGGLAIILFVFMRRKKSAAIPAKSV